MTNEKREAAKSVILQHCRGGAGFTEDSTMEDLGISSLEAMTVIFEIEDRMGITVEFSKIRGVKTVKQLLNILEGMADLESES